MSIVRLDPAFDALVPQGAQIEKLAGGFTFIEGPVWRPFGRALVQRRRSATSPASGRPTATSSSCFVPAATTATVCLPAGSSAPTAPRPATNGTVVMCQHGNRRIVRITNDLKVTTVVDSFEGKKFNSPNDVVYRSDGSLYFTDPPYGLPSSTTTRRRSCRSTACSS